ncbi:beta parvin [Echinococcus multilocularis]|uniref:Beta parvin n=1 Tax=Echinococcus multilocularis TaxID=6211 RepID=A0A068YDT9_ECHMU|nr:beta parvin [Echinococcus multilocularis]
MNSPGLSGTGNESFFSKLETLRSRNKKKSKKEVEDLAAEGRKAMESALCSLAVEDPENYLLEEGQERSIIERVSMESMEVKELVASLISWINDELINHRILVRNISDDLYDGQILQNLAEKLANIKLEHPEVTQSEFGQMQRLKEVVATINQILGVPESWAKDQWSAEMIHDKDVIAIIRLLVALAKHFKVGIRLADGVFLTVIVVRKINGILEYRYERKYLTEPSQSVPDLGPSSHPLDYLPNRHLVPRLITCFVNEHLQKLNLQVKDLAHDFSDGVRLILLMGLLEGYFVPLHCYHLHPTTDPMRLANVRLAFELMRVAELSEPLERPEDIILGDTKAVLRLLYGLVSHYQYEHGGGNAFADLQKITEDEALDRFPEFTA